MTGELSFVDGSGVVVEPARDFEVGNHASGNRLINGSNYPVEGVQALFEHVIGHPQLAYLGNKGVVHRLNRGQSDALSRGVIRKVQLVDKQFADGVRANLVVLVDPL